VSDTTMMTIATSLFGQKITHNLCLDKS
jgi:hypothetical protein